MESNPEALEDRKDVAYQQQPYTATGTTGYTANPAGSNVRYGEEKDPEQGMYQEMNPTGAAAGTTTTPTTRQTVRPTPNDPNAPASKTTVTVTTQQQQSQQPRFGGGFLGTFATRTRGRFFFPLHAGIALFAFLVLVSSALIESNAPNLAAQRFVQYGVVVGQISFAVAIGACVMERLGLLENPHIRVALSAFQVFFWAPALVILTFYGVFISPLLSANGFFGAWGALLTSAAIFSHEAERSKSDVSTSGHKSSVPRTSLLLLFFTSLMIMGSGIRIYSQQNAIPGGFDQPNSEPFTYTVFAIAFGSITAFLAVVYLIVLDSVATPVMFGLGVFLWCWVAAGILVLTFGDPFQQAVSNGYYACLFALLSSFGLLISLRSRDKEANANANAAPGTTGGATTAGGATTTTNPNASRAEGWTSKSYFMFMRAMTFSSLVVMVAAILVCRDNDGCDGRIQIFQVAAGAVPLGLGLIVVLLEVFGLWRVNALIKMLIALFFVCWWIASFIVLTFYGNFQTPALVTATFANGFFFTWAALVFAALAFAESLKERGRLSDPPSHLTAKSGLLLVIIIGSLIELGAAIKWWFDTDHNNLSRYAIALGTVSIGLVLILFFVLMCTGRNYESHDSVYNAGLYILTLWWAVGALVLTFDGFWTSAVDNGYFSLYFTLGACLLALSGMWRGEDDDFMDNTTTGSTRNY